MVLTGGSLTFELRVQDHLVESFKAPINRVYCGLKYVCTLTLENFKVAKERTEELYELFKE